MRRLLLVIMLITLFVSTLSADTAQAAEDPKVEIDRLVRDYYGAIAAEDLEKVALTLHLTDEEAARSLLLRYAVAFKATDIAIVSIEIKELQLDAAGVGGVVFGRVVATVSSADGSDSFQKDTEVALVVARSEDQWRILRATTRGRLEMERKLILYRQQLEELRKSEGSDTKDGNQKPKKTDPSKSPEVTPPPK